MRINDQEWNIFSVLRAFFPFQLIVSHLKKNVISLILWALLFAIINDSWGSAFGVPFLFLSPEYLDQTSWLSFFFLGFALGGFIMGFNTYSYMRLGPLYPFLITINRPFFKFCINNALIPAIFVVNYLVCMTEFHQSEEYAATSEILVFILAFLTGIALFLFLSFLLFFRLIKHDRYEDNASEPFKSVVYQESKWYDVFRRQEDFRSLYIGSKFRIRTSRSTKHFDREVVEKVYSKNRVSATLYEILTIGIFFGLGFFNESEVLEVPAAASIVLLVTICLMLFSALRSWLRGWLFPVFVLTIVVMNYMSNHTAVFRYTSYVYGLDYTETEPAEYSVDRIQAISSDSIQNAKTYASYLRTLEAWKKRTGEKKPKLIIINTSGGGSRSAMWTLVVMQHLDSLTHSDFTTHTQMITGASGGMVGASYYRELFLQKSLGEIETTDGAIYRNRIGRDILNRLSFMASTNDIFVRYQKLNYNNHSYRKDRGYAFEQQLLHNTGGILDHNLGYYTDYEKKGQIPTMIFSPTIINDGRRLFIGAQNLNFLASGAYADLSSSRIYENIDIHSLLPNQDVDKMKFSSVIRSSATFPFVLPMVTIPTSPEIQLMDAGIRDNYGTKTTMLFLESMKEWIEENTSGVIIVEIRDKKKIYENERFQQVSFLDKMTLPFGNMYKNFPRVQNYNQVELMQFTIKSLDYPIDLVTINLMNNYDQRISLSWHLTSLEKIKICNSLQNESNQKAFDRIKKLITEKK